KPSSLSMGFWGSERRFDGSNAHFLQGSPVNLRGGCARMATVPLHLCDPWGRDRLTIALGWGASAGRLPEPPRAHVDTCPPRAYPGACSELHCRLASTAKSC